MEELKNHWKDLFQAWPADLPRRGVLITTWDEQIPFSSFLTSEAFLLLERTTPDSLGGRAILLPFTNVVGVKIVDPLKPKAYQPLGFSPPPEKPRRSDGFGSHDT